MLSGIFEYGNKPLVLSENRIEMKAEAGSVVSGSFSAASPDERQIRGFVYASSPRVSFDPSEFYGKDNVIRFRISTNGLDSGETIEGAFTISTPLGESQLPFSVRIEEKGFEERKECKVGSSAELSEMAKEDLAEAFIIFRDDSFGQMLREKEPDHLYMYEKLAVDGLTQQDMEEFLIGCGLKEPVELTLEKNTVFFPKPESSRKESVQITASGWGFLNIQVSSDCRFLRVDKKQLTTLSFVGDHYELEYIVDTNYLHAGKNYGRIIIQTCYQTSYLNVCVTRRRTGDSSPRDRVRNLMRRTFLELYLDLRTNKIELPTWVERSASVIGSYQRSGGDDVFADLMLVQVYFADGRMTRAQRLLMDLENQQERFKTKAQIGFYLYLTTFFQKDKSYVDDIEEQISRLLAEDKANWILQWILLFLHEENLNQPAVRLEAIRSQVDMGCCSPIMYLEAVQVYANDPFLLHSLDDFAQKVLLFAAKHSMITRELAFQIANLAGEGVLWQKRVFQILTICYRKYPLRDLLKSIVTLLIFGRKKDRKYFRWYAQAVDEDIRINGLYEYYMETMGSMGIEKVPQVIRTYLAYSQTLSWGQKARIYRNISDNRDHVPQVYRSNRSQIEQFVMEQLSLGKIDENLAVLYERFITRKMLTRSQAERLIRILFTFRVECRNPKITHVVVAHPTLREQQKAAFVNSTAHMQIYTDDAVIFLEDHQGRRYVSDSLYQLTRYMDSPLLMTYCRELYPTHPGLVLHMCSKDAKITKENLAFYRQACDSDLYTEEWKKSLRIRILEYYDQNRQEENLYEWLKGLQTTAWAQADRKILVSLLTQEGLYEKAFEILKKWGSEHVPPDELVRICSQYVLIREYEKDPVLLSLCHQCYQYGKDDNNILNYLLMYYEGPVEEMKRLWNSGHDSGFDTMGLEERILNSILFTRSSSAGSESVFAAYQQKLGNSHTCKAYVILKSWEYLICSLPVGDIVFHEIEQGVKHEAKQKDICLLALLQYYSRMDELDQTRQEIVRSLLEEFGARGIRLAFFRNFPRKLRPSLQMEDRVFLEYSADPRHTVSVRYRLPGDQTPRQDVMKCMFENIFVKEFILFEGETMECTVKELDGDVLVQEQTMSLKASPTHELEGSRYAMISEMIRAEASEDQEKLRQLLASWQQMDALTKELFTVL